MGHILANNMGLQTKPINCLNQFNAHMKFTQVYVSQDKPSV